MTQPDEAAVVRRTYTHARRFQQWVRWVMGWQLPVALQAAQFIGAGATLVLLVQTRQLWAAALGWQAQTLVLLCGPAVVMGVIRLLPRDGTGPVAVAAGLAALATSPRRGRRAGRPAPAPRPHRIPATYSVTLTPVPAVAVAETAVVPIAVAVPAAEAPEPAAAAGVPVPVARAGGERVEAPAGRARLVSVAELTRAAEALAAGQFRDTAADAAGDSGWDQTEHEDDEQLAATTKVVRTA